MRFERHLLHLLASLADGAASECCLRVPCLLEGLPRSPRGSPGSVLRPATVLLAMHRTPAGDAVWTARHGLCAATLRDPYNLTLSLDGRPRLRVYWPREASVFPRPWLRRHVTARFLAPHGDKLPKTLQRRFRSVRWRDAADAAFLVPPELCPV